MTTPDKPHYGLELGKQISLRPDEQMRKDVSIIAAHYGMTVVSDIVKLSVNHLANGVRRRWQAEMQAAIQKEESQ